jgi:hypothetical protein
LAQCRVWIGHRHSEDRIYRGGPLQYRQVGSLRKPQASCDKIGAQSCHRGPRNYQSQIAVAGIAVRITKGHQTGVLWSSSEIVLIVYIPNVQVELSPRSSAVTVETETDCLGG